MRNAGDGDDLPEQKAVDFERVKASFKGFSLTELLVLVLLLIRGKWTGRRGFIDSGVLYLLGLKN